MKKVKKRSNPWLLLILSLIVIFFLTFLFLPRAAECKIDSDCVPSSCCHSISCVPVEKQPDCQGIFCTQDCVPNSLDCQQGSCACIEGKCSVNWSEK